MLEVHTFQVLELGIPELPPRFQICPFSGGRPRRGVPFWPRIKGDNRPSKKISSPAARKKAKTRKRPQKRVKNFFSPAAQRGGIKNFFSNILKKKFRPRAFYCIFRPLFFSTLEIWKFWKSFEGGWKVFEKFKKFFNFSKSFSSFSSFSNFHPKNPRKFHDFVFTGIFQDFKFQFQFQFPLVKLGQFPLVKLGQFPLVKLGQFPPSGGSLTRKLAQLPPSGGSLRGQFSQFWVTSSLPTTSSLPS